MAGPANPWDIEVQSDGHQADGDGDGKGDDGADFQGDLKGDDGAVQEDAAQEGRRRVDFLAQDAGDAPGQDVADDAAADSCQDAEGNVSSLVVWNAFTKSDVSSVTKVWMPLTTLSSHLSKFTKLTLTSTIS